MSKPHPTEVFGRFGMWETQMRRILSQPGGAHNFPMHIVHYIGRDASGRLRAFDVMIHEDDHEGTITFGETRVDGTEPKTALSGQDAGMYMHYHVGRKENTTLEQSLVDFIADEQLTGLTQVAETFTVGELQFQMIDIVRQLVEEFKETAN